jgi:hypothetical protein
MAGVMSRSDGNNSRTADANPVPRWLTQTNGQHGSASDEPPPTSFSARVRADMVAKINELQSWFVGRHPG